MGDVGELDPISRNSLESDRSVACVMQLDAVPLRDGSFTFDAVSLEAASRAHSTLISRLPSSSTLANVLRSHVCRSSPDREPVLLLHRCWRTSNVQSPKRVAMMSSSQHT